MTPVAAFLKRVKSAFPRRREAVRAVAMGCERTFRAWDDAEDTYIFEDGVSRSLDSRPSVLVAQKGALRRGAKGRVFTMTTGNHSVAAFPLLDGRFWGLSTLRPDKRGRTLTEAIVCANVAGGRIEISQRDVPPRTVFDTDAWLVERAGFGLGGVVLADRNDATIERYRSIGQEWRVKPLAWTWKEMKAALAASRKNISCDLKYFHSSKGVHFLTLREFSRLAGMARDDWPRFLKCLGEIVNVYEGNMHSFARMPKYRGHHEIELFGLRRGVGAGRIVPELEKTMEDAVLGRLDAAGAAARMEETARLYASLLASPSLADEESRAFAESLYMHVTGEVYSGAGEGVAPAFDDRRAALPGATFEGGRPVFHPGADARTEVLLSNLRSLMSKDEVVEYANVYELRSGDETAPPGRGSTREVVYKTNRGPVERSFVEKRLSRAAKGYSGYMLARVQAFKALGISLSDYRVLKRRAGVGKRQVDVYIRRRCEGEPMESIPESYFRNADDSSIEEKETVLALAGLMGDAAAQNLAMKKYDPATKTPLYGVGKEIYEFEYDIAAGRVVPKSVSTCSVRGSLGWPDLERSDGNVSRCFAFYLAHFAHTLKAYQRRHNVSMQEVAGRFMDGFERRTRAMEWSLSVMRDRFETFRPGLPASYGFDAKWGFAMWSLERQERRLDTIRKMFCKRVEIEENEDVRDNSESLGVEQIPGQAAGGDCRQAPGGVGS